MNLNQNLIDLYRCYMGEVQHPTAAACLTFLHFVKVEAGPIELELHEPEPATPEPAAKPPEASQPAKAPEQPQTPPEASQPAEPAKAPEQPQTQPEAKPEPAKGLADAEVWSAVKKAYMEIARSA